MQSLNEWFSEVVKNMEHIEINRNKEKRNLDLKLLTKLKWLTKLKVQTNSHILEKLKNDSKLEKENKQMKKEILEQRLLLVEYKRKIDAQLEEARIREENLIRSNHEFKEEMKKQLETTNSLIRDLMDMVQKQAKP